MIVMHTTYMQVPPGLKIPPQLKWRRGRPDMPFAMSAKIQSVLIQDTLYIGGGDTDYGSNNGYRVMTYDISAGKWATLPPYSTHFFAMTVINNQLLSVGGMGRDCNFSKVLGVWSEDSKKWTHPYPDMTTPRRSCSAVVYKQYLVVAGGKGVDGRLSSVEIMNTNTKQWYAGCPTPIAWSSMKTAIVGDMCYFMGGLIESDDTTRVYSVSLPALVSQLNSDSSANDTQTWKELPELPVVCAAPLSISESLLAVGGKDKVGKDMCALHLYQPDAGQWVKVADMPTPRHTAISSMITDKTLLVAGGYNNGHLATMDLTEIY